jgi:hypothetical protein
LLCGCESSFQTLMYLNLIVDGSSHSSFGVIPFKIVPCLVPGDHEHIHIEIENGSLL